MPTKMDALSKKWSFREKHEGGPLLNKRVVEAYC
jgi:hypothetical protein